MIQFEADSWREPLQPWSLPNSAVYQRVRIDQDTSSLLEYEISEPLRDRAVFATDWTFYIPEGPPYQFDMVLDFDYLRDLESGLARIDRTHRHNGQSCSLAETRFSRKIRCEISVQRYGRVTIPSPAPAMADRKSL